jgi:hypothetical protein
LDNMLLLFSFLNPPPTFPSTAIQQRKDEDSN